MTIVSQAAADRFIRERIVPRRLLSVVTNGIDPELFHSATADARASVRRSLQVGDRFVWLAVGRFEIAKDYPNMLRAFAAVRERQPQSVLLLVGRGSLQAETEALAQELGLADSVRFTGIRQDVPAIMGAADGYVMSSAWEGMPMVLLEAAAAGLPIVATRAGGNDEVVRDSETGFLVSARDSEALAAAMLRLMGLSEDQRRAMGQRGREHVRAQYGLERVVERWEELYLAIALRKGSPSFKARPGRLRPDGVEPGAPPQVHS
jgi:glycosyltransferase involved in cell wall biosynthesis